MRASVALLAVVMLALTIGAGSVSAQAPAAKVTPRTEFTAYIDSLLRKRLAERVTAVAAINDQAAAETRKAWAKKTVLDLIGGLPAQRGPLNVKTFGSVQAGEVRVEKITFDSLPGYHVTADVYVPAGKGLFPAVIMSPGHTANGKISERTLAMHLARAGILALAYDITGQGERYQYWDPDLEASRAGSATAEHSMEAWQVMPVGGHVARYFVWDAMRGLDYLESRKDVDRSRLGAFGCSGGGTVTAYLSALDDRVKAAGTACYVTTMDKLLDRVGPQEAEQSIPGFVAQGLDIADWVEMAAPKPYAIISTTEDMFPYAGAKTAHDEAQRIYGLYGKADNLSWIVGPGPHGALRPLYPQIVAFYNQHLNRAAPLKPLQDLPEPSDEAVTVTPTGQIATSLGGETLQSINVKQAAKVMRGVPQVKTATEAAALRARLKAEAKALLHTEAAPGAAAPLVRVVNTQTRDGVRLQTVRLKTLSGLELDGTVATPASAGKHPAVLLLTKQDTGAAVSSQALALAKTGKVVLALTARASGAGEQKGALLGDWNLLALRTLLIDKVPLGMNLDDAIQAMDYLAASADVDPSAISVYGLGLAGPVALHLALLDDRVASVAVDGSLLEYRMAADARLMKSLPEVLPQGVLTHYDLGDLVLAAAPRKVAIVNPVNALGLPVLPSKAQAALAYVRAADRLLGDPTRTTLATRAPNDPLVIP